MYAKNENWEVERIRDHEFILFAMREKGQKNLKTINKHSLFSLLPSSVLGAKKTSLKVIEKRETETHRSPSRIKNILGIIFWSRKNMQNFHFALTSIEFSTFGRRVIPYLLSFTLREGLMNFFLSFWRFLYVRHKTIVISLYGRFLECGMKALKTFLKKKTFKRKFL